jgi:hypothetical protein
LITLTDTSQHASAEAALEDRHVAAELALRETLSAEQSACLLKLRHMEAYCDGLNAGGAIPGRVVTERDLRELGQQYNLRDSMAQLHQSRINVLREKQGQALESLAGMQEHETGALRRRIGKEAKRLEERFARDEREIEIWLSEKKRRVLWRWAVEEEVLKEKLREQNGLEYANLAPIVWPVVTRESIEDREGTPKAGDSDRVEEPKVIEQIVASPYTIKRKSIPSTPTSPYSSSVPATVQEEPTTQEEGAMTTQRPAFMKHAPTPSNVSALSGVSTVGSIGDVSIHEATVMTAGVGHFHSAARVSVMQPQTPLSPTFVFSHHDGEARSPMMT